MSAAPEGGAGLCGLVHVQFAAALMGGEVGATLFETLCAEFPAISRWDVFAGIALAWTQMQADLVMSEAEARRLRQQLERWAAA